MDNEKLPDAIKDVEGKYYNGNVIDRFSGNPYLMLTKTDDANKELIYLYSTGPNLVDDKGQSNKETANTDDIKVTLKTVESNNE